MPEETLYEVMNNGNVWEISPVSPDTYRARKKGCKLWDEVDTDLAGMREDLKDQLRDKGVLEYDKFTLGGGIAPRYCSAKEIIFIYKGDSMKGETKLRKKGTSPSENDSELTQQEFDVSVQRGCYTGKQMMKIMVECPECKKKHNLFKMYKCFFCHFYFCEECAKGHFDSTHNKEDKNDSLKMCSCGKVGNIHICDECLSNRSAGGEIINESSTKR